MTGRGSNPLVSVLVPAYNAEAWIRQSLDSAFEQTYAPAEVIVVDDGSLDRTVEIVRGYGDRVRLVEADHGGGNAARNRLLSLAKGEWVQYLDADDYLLPEKISSQMEEAVKTPDLDVAYSPIFLLDESNGSRTLLEIDPDSDITFHFIRWGSLNTNAFLFRRQTLVDIGGWNLAQLACQEHELVFRLICAGKKFKLVNRPGAVYRYHGAPSVSRKDPLRTLRLKNELLDKMQTHLERNRILTAPRQRELYAARMESARSAWKLDPAGARALAKSARTTGTWWISSSPALPASFQLANRILGFAGAESLGAFLRGKRRDRI